MRIRKTAPVAHQAAGHITDYCAPLEARYSISVGCSHLARPTLLAARPRPRPDAEKCGGKVRTRFSLALAIAPARFENFIVISAGGIEVAVPLRI